MVYVAFVIGLIVPIYAVYLGWSSRHGGWLQWLLKAIAAVGVMGFLTLVGRWDFSSVYLVWFWWAATLAALGLGALATRGKSWSAGAGRGKQLLAALDPLIALLLFGYAASGLLHGPTVDLRPPFAEGRFYVAHGGGNPLINYHSSHPPQRYALDIAELDAFGRRAGGIAPAALESYVIYGRETVSPCAGEVTAAIDGIPDNRIGETNRNDVAGNHVVIACEGIDLTLAHFRPGTLAVETGDSVNAGQPLGEVGNSGNSTEPHLHIHAVPSGGEEGVPLALDGAFLVRNATFEGRP